MKIAVFGSSGAIGKLFIEQAQAAGHQLRLYSRKTSVEESENTRLFIGELTDEALIRTAIAGADAVVSLLGPPLKFWYAGMPITTGHENIITAMKAEKVNRLITIGTPSIKFKKDSFSLPTVMPGLLARILFPKPYREITAIGKIVQASGLDWTIVRFIAPLNGTPTGKAKVSFGDQKISFSVTRADIADFVLQQLSTDQYSRSMPIIGS